MKRIMEQLLDETALPSRPQAGSPVAVDDGTRDWIRFHAAEPRLVDSRNEFNFVQYMDLVYAIKQSVGPLDVAVEANTLLERFGPDVVVVAQTLEEARAKVDLQLAGSVSSARNFQLLRAWVKRLSTQHVALVRRRPF